MRLWALVHCVLHNATDQQRTDFYSCLERKAWRRINENGITTSWKGTINLEEETNYQPFFRSATRSFQSCALEVKLEINLVVQLGPNQPVEY